MLRTKRKQLWDHAASIGTYHVMANYLAHSMHMFEHRFDAYTTGGDALPIMSAEPLLGAHEIQLIHRFFHNNTPMLHHHFEDE